MSKNDDDPARTLQLSVQENKSTPLLTLPPPSRSMTSAVDNNAGEGIRRCLDLNHSRVLVSLWASPKLREEDELERTIRLSIESADNASSALARTKDHRENSIDFGDKDDFPALSSSPQNSPPSRGRDAVWGHRKEEEEGLVTHRSFYSASLSSQCVGTSFCPALQHLVCDLFDTQLLE